VLAAIVRVVGRARRDVVVRVVAAGEHNDN
jgi:hypothetical protein